MFNTGNVYFLIRKILKMTKYIQDVLKLLKMLPKKKKRRLRRNDGLCKAIGDFWGVELRYWWDDWRHL